MDELRFSHDLLAQGYSFAEVRRMTRAGELHRVRRGAYAVAPVESDPAAAHLQLIGATVPRMSPDAVVSHMSAAVLHGLPSWSTELSRVHLTRNRPNGGKLGRLTHLHASVLRPEDITVVGGQPVTTLARTVVDLCRTLPMERSVPVGDAALRSGLESAALEDVLDSCSGWPGITAARRAVEFLDARSETVGESFSRVVLRQLGLPSPTLQFEVIDDRGRLVGRTDFCWEKQRILGEFDGKIKYGRLLRPGQTAGDVVFDEKRREDAMRDLRWQMVRWTWEDLLRPADLRRRLERAFARCGA